MPRQGRLPREGGIPGLRALRPAPRRPGSSSPPPHHHFTDALSPHLPAALVPSARHASHGSRCASSERPAAGLPSARGDRAINQHNVWTILRDDSRQQHCQCHKHMVVETMLHCTGQPTRPLPRPGTHIPQAGHKFRHVLPTSPTRPAEGSLYFTRPASIYYFCLAPLP